MIELRFRWMNSKRGINILKKILLISKITHDGSINNYLYSRTTVL